MTWDTFLRLWRWGAALSLLGVLQFGICLFVAAGKYTGGTPVSVQAVGYTFYANFLSDLGRTVAWSGVSNQEAATLFNTSLILLAATQVPFFLSLPLHVSDKPVMLWSAAALGIVSCAGLAGVGLTPYDAHLRGHVTALLWWIVPLLVALMLHLIIGLGAMHRASGTVSSAIFLGFLCCPYGQRLNDCQIRSKNE